MANLRGQTKAPCAIRWHPKAGLRDDAKPSGTRGEGRRGKKHISSSIDYARIPRRSKRAKGTPSWSLDNHRNGNHAYPGRGKKCGSCGRLSMVPKIDVFQRELATASPGAAAWRVGAGNNRSSWILMYAQVPLRQKGHLPPGRNDPVPEGCDRAPTWTVIDLSRTVVCPCITLLRPL